jgi:hypothetical protein
MRVGALRSHSMVVAAANQCRHPQPQASALVRCWANTCVIFATLETFFAAATVCVELYCFDVTNLQQEILELS